MRNLRLLPPAFLLTILCFLVPTVLAQERRDTDTEIERILSGPERQDIPWKVSFFEPQLMYQQRYLVQVRARIPVSAVRGPDSRNLRFVLKAQTEDGTPIKGGQYNDFKVPANLGKESEIEYASGVYFRPGNYVVILAAWDSTSRQSNVVRKTVHIPVLKDDPFPDLDKYVEVAEFPRNFPDQEVSSDDVNSGELFPLAHLGGAIAIANQKPILVDVVLNMSERPKPVVPRPRMWDRPIRAKPRVPLYHLDIGRILQVGNVLGHLGLRSGCVRISAMDVLRAKTVLDREDTRKLDWASFEEQALKLDQSTVDARILQNKKAPAEYAQKFFDDLSADKSGCEAASAHYIIVVSHQVTFPARAKEDRVTEAAGERARFIYFYSAIATTLGDDFGDLLKPVRPERLSFAVPKDVRKSLAKIVEQLQAQ